LLDDVRDARVRAVRGTAPTGGGSLVWLHAVRDAELRDLDPRAGRTVARLSGAETAGIRLGRHDGERFVVVDHDVSEAALEVDAS
jgi:hypothetical protein